MIIQWLWGTGQSGIWLRLVWFLLKEGKEVREGEETAHTTRRGSAVSRYRLTWLIKAKHSAHSGKFEESAECRGGSRWSWNSSLSPSLDYWQWKDKDLSHLPLFFFKRVGDTQKYWLKKKMKGKIPKSWELYAMLWTSDFLLYQIGALKSC